MKKEINYYGEEDNYIHLKFGECRKCYNFTKDFVEKYKEFVEDYDKYFMNEDSKFENAEEVVNYVFDNEIPVNWYFNFTDEPAESKEEILEYLTNEN